MYYVFCTFDKVMKEGRDLCDQSEISISASKSIQVRAETNICEGNCFKHFMAAVVHGLTKACY